MMGMTRRLILLAAAFCSIVLRAEDLGEVLWWKIDNLSSITAEGSDVSAESLGVNAARIRYESGDAVNYLSIYAVSGNNVHLTTGTGEATLLPGAFFSSLGSASGVSYNFVIELGNWSTEGGWISTSMESQAVSYDYLKEAQHIAKWLDTVPVYATPWTPTSFSVVPEPSSGVLLLVASAMLALRRRKMRENG